MAEVCKDDDLSQFELCYSNVSSSLRRPLPSDSSCRRTTATFTAFVSDVRPNVLTLCVVLPAGNELLSLQNKKGRNKSAAVQFVKKDWGKRRRVGDCRLNIECWSASHPSVLLSDPPACKEKAKAEKLKKRWIHKQQIPS